MCCPGRLIYHLSTIKAAAAQWDRTPAHVEVRQEARVGLDVDLHSQQARALQGTTHLVSHHTSRLRVGHWAEWNQNIYTAQPGRACSRALEDACLNVCFSPSLQETHQFLLAKKTLINHSAQLQGSPTGRVAPQWGCKENLKLWLCEMFTTETFVSQAALGLLKWISRAAEKCPSVSLMATFPRGRGSGDLGGRNGVWLGEDKWGHSCVGAVGVSLNTKQMYFRPEYSKLNKWNGLCFVNL